MDGVDAVPGGLDPVDEVVPDWLTDLFERQRAFQESLGYDLFEMTNPERIEYIKMNVIALSDEVHEALGEVRWKPWARGEKQINDPARFGGELVDALHFLLNLFLVAGWDAERVYTAFVAKNEVNRQRQASGYDGVSTKCAFRGCRRALDELEAGGVVREGTLAWCHEGCYDAWQQDVAGEVLEAGGGGAA